MSPGDDEPPTNELPVVRVPQRAVAEASTFYHGSHDAAAKPVSSASDKLDQGQMVQFEPRKTSDGQSDAPVSKANSTGAGGPTISAGMMGPSTADAAVTIAKPRHPRLRWIVLLTILLALVLGSGGGLWWLFVDQQWVVSPAASTVPSDVFGTPSSPSQPVTSATPPDPVAECLAGALNAVPYSGNGTLSGQVNSLATGALLWGRAANQARLPASNEKLLTALALVDALGKDAATSTFTTSVVSVGTDRIVLVGGGDPYLASSQATAKLGQPASLNDLASATAAALSAQGRTSVTLGFDASAFSGPNWLDSWQSGDVIEVTRVSALWVDEGRTPNAAGTVPRIGSTTPALDAAKLFATQLKAHGVTVTSIDTASQSAPAGASQLAAIDSLPLGDIIARTMLVSDNSAAEVLLRHLAIAKGQAGSFANGAKAVMDWVNSIGLGTPGLNIVDGSGLSRANAVPASVLAGAVTWAGASDGPGREVLARLPVAYVSGTLIGRFSADNTSAGRGWVHAKTGSLSGVATLSGYTVTTQGQVLAFSFIVNNDTKGAAGMHSWLDQMAATLTSAVC